MKKLLLSLLLIANITTLSFSSINSEEKIEKARNIQYKTITSPYTGKVWLDRNLGAKRVCKSFTDTQCYGNYYKFREDGRDVCPNGFRIPTKDELALETTNQGYSYKGNFLKLPATGYQGSGKAIGGQGFYGSIWSSSDKGKYAWRLIFDSSSADLDGSGLSMGLSVRCLKD